MWRGNRGSWSVGNFDYFRQRLTSVERFCRRCRHQLQPRGQRRAGARVRRPRRPGITSRCSASRPRTAERSSTDEDQPGRNKVVMLSDRLWRRRFGADPAMVGRSIRINNEPHDVVGIMPARWIRSATPRKRGCRSAFTPEQLAMYDEFYLNAYARQTAGLSPSSRSATSSSASRRSSRPIIRTSIASAVADVELLSTFYVGDYRLRLFMLLAAVALVLLIACGNVANLLLARLAARSRELAIRAAIGAGRGRIVRQVLTESLVLAALGGIAGLAIAWWSLPVLIRLAPGRRAAARNGDAQRRRCWRRRWRWSSAARCSSACCRRGRRRGARRSPRISATARARSADRSSRGCGNC